jgi:spoIIIJ-associated protein
MENSLVRTAKSVEEAVELALKDLGIGRDEVEVEVISLGKTGFLGLGGEQAQVRITPLTASGEVVRTAKIIIDQLIAHLGVKALSTISKPPKDSPGFFLIDIEGEDSGLLIGRRGETLRAMQFLVNLLVTQARGAEDSGRILLDVEHYRERRANSLRDRVLRLADRVATSGKPITLEPMPANERRVVHMALSDHLRVITQSEGLGEERQVIIQPRHGR